MSGGGGMGCEIRLPETISVYYRMVGPVHVFTSPELRGLHIGNEDLAEAFRLIPVAVSGLLEIKTGVHAVYEPDVSFAEFEEHLNDLDADALAAPALQMKMGERNHFVRGS
ncbi:hypothetical protein HL658_29700 [Azospirillum sp. RWY-5-1]|uniref:Uncharacterized protein n=1 Tax=Azospirillum oleiclasticum TaxID=2735135 RepID=A0ABX2TGA0_9PROT|nr:hypothetical protein [Azospirillum oleiclasticum]NYZ16741.1 hypothetical protein [Azospirillum oleiclasticum]NYZ23357.1 hypothetical protein [Azospirillum oleiclasticum]